MSAAQTIADPASLSLTAALDAMRGGRLLAVDLASAYADRIARAETLVQAWAWFDRERLLAAARRIDAQRRRGMLLGALAGAPIGIKDIIATAGVPTRLGSPIFEHNVPTASAACVQQIEAAGGIVQGKTVTTEFANRKPGPTANPWNLLHTPGGSSSGSAAAVAAGFTAAAVGSQTLGSTIRPAAYCGVVGYKPSFGLVSRRGVHPLSPSLDHVGVLARTIDDAALLASCLIGFDPQDPASLPDAGRLRLGGGSDELPRPPRLAAVRTAHWAQAEPSQQQRFEADCGLLRAAGAAVEFVDLPAGFERANEFAAMIQAVEAARHFGELRATKAEQMSAEFRALCDRGAAIAGADYDAALAAQASLRRALAPLLRDYDAIVTLAAAGEAPPLGASGAPTFCSAWTLCGVPALVLPTGLGPQRLPLGLQLVAAHLADRQLLRVARWCRSRLDDPGRPALPG
jgi:Asp-tRNA(Asn)/Glu-tRNA(Gln) amidotransferase A subunit family amidase